MIEESELNKINDAINNHYRRYNRGRDNDAWVEGCHSKLNWVALKWHNFMDIYQRYFHPKRTALYVLRTFPNVDGVFISGSLYTRRDLRSQG